MGQHFLLSAKARTLSVVEVARLSADEAYAAFKAVRFADNGGEAFCPHCGCTAVYEYQARRIFKCKACEKQFSATSGTLFSSRKFSYCDILVAIALFANGANGVAALRLSREMRCSYKAAFVLAHKLREVMGLQRTKEKLTGIVEVDGVWIGGYFKHKNPIDGRRQNKRSPRREDFTAEEWERVLKAQARRRSIVTLRERRRGGRTISFVARTEAERVIDILALTAPEAVLHTDEAPHWNMLDLHRVRRSVNHSKTYYSEGVHTNLAESFNSRVRRAERGVYHHISGRHLQGYADEIAWREDYRRVSNGQQFTTIMRGAALAPVSREWKGYWQRRKGDDPGPSRQRMVLPE